MIYVGPLSCVLDTVRTHSPSRLISLLDPKSMIDTPEGFAAERHLRISVNDIAHPEEGLVAPSDDHVRELIDFIGGWDREGSILIHCWGGVSRSTAAAFVALCMLNEHLPEDRLARLIRARGAHAYPNRRIVGIADEMLGRKGRMRDAVVALGPGKSVWEGTLFSIPVYPGPDELDL